MFIYPSYSFKIRKNKNTQSTEIWDIVRKQWVTLTPEEMVRQHLIHYLIYAKGYPLEMLCVEKEFYVYQSPKRFDVAVLNKKQEFILVAECKAPYMILNEHVLRQLEIYNIALHAQCLVITNGISQYVLKNINGQWEYIQDIEMYKKHI